MKTLLTILICISSFCIFGQSLTLHSYSPDKLCACDSVQILLKWKQGSYPVNINVGNIQTNQSNTVLFKVLSPQDFAEMDKAMDGLDVVYIFYLKVPCNITQLQPSPINDRVLIEITFGNEVKNIYVTVTDCVSGIQEYDLNDPQPIYFDLYGHKIEKRANEVIIKQVGNKRTKMLIYE